MKTLILFITLFIFCSLTFSQDVASSKDHPLFNRMPGYKIDSYEEKDFDVYDKFRDEKGKQRSVEGHYYFISYYISKGEKGDINKMQEFICSADYPHILVLVIILAVINSNLNEKVVLFYTKEVSTMGRILLMSQI